MLCIWIISMHNWYKQFRYRVDIKVNLIPGRPLVPACLCWADWPGCGACTEEVEPADVLGIGSTGLDNKLLSTGFRVGLIFRAVAVVDWSGTDIGTLNWFDIWLVWPPCNRAWSDDSETLCMTVYALGVGWSNIRRFIQHNSVTSPTGLTSRSVFVSSYAFSRVGASTGRLLHTCLSTVFRSARSQADHTSVLPHLEICSFQRRTL